MEQGQKKFHEALAYAADDARTESGLSGERTAGQSRAEEVAELSQRGGWAIGAATLIASVFIVWGAALSLLFPNSLELVSNNWMITPVAFLAAAFANATAVGGGFLFVPLFIFGYGLAPVAAVKLGLATQAFGMTSGSFGWSRKFIVTKALVIAGVASVAGMYVGTYEFFVSNSLVKQTFGWVSLAIFVAVMLEIKYGQFSHNHDIINDSLLKAVLFAVAAFLGGIVTAWTAIGIGEVVALYLLFVYRIRIEAAIGTGVAALALDSIAGFIFHTSLGGVIWEYLAFTVPGVILGGFFGARLARIVEEMTHLRRSQRSDTVLTNHSPLKWLLAGVILVDGAAMLVQSY